MPVLYPASDAFVSFISKNEALLREHFLFLLPKKELLEQILSKSAQSDLAIKHGSRFPPELGRV
jgi:hypothetical protein